MKMPRTPAVKHVAIAGVVVFVLLQAVRPDIPAKPAAAELQAPPQVKRILEKNCYSCHSDQRRLSWFDQIVPAYWLVRHDVLAAREHLNFSTLGSKPAAAQKAALYEAVNMIQLGAMPLPSFVKMHPEAKVTAEELAALKTYLAPWTTVPSYPVNLASANGARAKASPPSYASFTPVSLEAVSPELNGLSFDSTFESWKVISTTDRGDNNTFRFILGNDVAVRAALLGNLTPWPDGARFAKIAWQQEPGSDGLMHPGKFVQVELMVKDAAHYKSTDGWGWGRWRGADLKPYGNDAHFVNECTGCHQPVRGNDYVFTLPITTAEVRRDEVVNNRAAELPMSLPYQPLGWNAITMYADPKAHTMAVLFGNDAAVSGALARGVGAAAPAYKPGSVLALVTWAQRDDPHWFGARIPDMPLSIEFVGVRAAGETSRYWRFAGPRLTNAYPEADVAAQRASFIAALAPAQMP